MQIKLRDNLLQVCGKPSHMVALYRCDTLTGQVLAEIGKQNILYATIHGTHARCALHSWYRLIQ